MASNNTITNIKKHKFKWNLDIGLVIFGMILIYLIANLIQYFMTSHISVYEVREGSIITDNAYTGFAVRSEEVTYASSSGYVNYLINEGDKASVGSPVYQITQSKQNASTEDESVELSSENRKELITRTQTFNLSYSAANFGSVYDFSYECESNILDYINSNQRQSISSDMISGETAESDGIVAFTIDGYENITTANFKPSYLNRSDYSKMDVRNQGQLSSGDPVYKTITNDTWYLYLALSDETAEALKDTETLDVLFKKDNDTVSGALTITEMDGQKIARLEFSNSVVRYANDRYLDVELVLDNQSGLKIPKSTVVEKDFYAIPNTCITKGGNSNSDGVYVQSDKNGDSVFQTLEIYSSDDEYSYVSVSELEEGSILLEPETNDTYTINKTKKLKGVYNINKGYAVFETIKILNGNDTYYIVKAEDSSGLSNYDQIVLDGTQVDENEVVFQ